MHELDRGVRIELEACLDVPILTVEGVLDSSTYRAVRDAVIKAAIDAPRAVMVDINELHAPCSSAWTVLTSARWHVSVWPDVPILLVCATPEVRRAISEVGITRYLPVYPTPRLALEGLKSQIPCVRRRARTSLARNISSLQIARSVVAEWLTRWDIREVIPVSATLATVLVENVLDHTEGAPVLIIERFKDGVVVAVEDNSFHLPGRHEDADRGADIVSGLAIVATLCQAWGASPTPSGKTVWAVIGREDQL